MFIIDIAQNVWKNELAEPSDISVPYLCSYFRANYGDLNNLLGICLILNSTSLELVDQNGNLIDSGAASVYKYIYLTKYYERQVRNFLGVGSVNVNILVSAEDAMGGSIKFLDRNQIAKTYLQLRKDTQEILNKLINKYKFRNQNALDVTGDDIYVRPLYNNGDSLYQGQLY